MSVGYYVFNESNINDVSSGNESTTTFFHSLKKIVSSTRFDYLLNETRPAKCVSDTYMIPPQ